ncbi:MAG: hypothetical protein KGZ39_04200 [Simkania sp.]|nr:hypothetical protein [Simkania sp.]
MTTKTQDFSNYYSYLPLPNYTDRTVLPKATVIGGEIIDPLRRLVDSFANTVDYNTLGLLCQYIRFYQERKITHQNISEAQAFLEFQPLPTEEIDLNHGASCIGQSEKLVQLIRENLHLSAYISPSQKSPTTPPHHMSVVLPCQDSIILINPTDPPRMVHIDYERSTTVLLKGEEYDFSMPKNGLSIAMTKKSERKTSDSLVANLTNSTEMVAKQVILQRKQYPIVSYDAEGNLRSVIKLDIDHETIILQKGAGTSAQRLELPFSSFKLQTNTFSEKGLSEAQKTTFLSKGFFSFFKISQKKLRQQIHTIIANTTTIQKLYAQTHTPKFQKHVTPRDLTTKKPPADIRDHILQKFSSISTQDGIPIETYNPPQTAELLAALQKAPLDSQVALDAFNTSSLDTGLLQPVYDSQLETPEASLNMTSLNSETIIPEQSI